jgi:TrmH family RNA methyltransferase
MERISSRHNVLVKRFRELARPGGDQREMLLDGQHLVEEAITSGLVLDVAAFAARHVEGRLALLAARVAHSGTRTVEVSDDVLAAVSPVQQPSGVVAIARRPASVLRAVFEREPQLVLLLHGIQDPGNVGAIVRAAEACGATGIVMCEGTADPFGWKALRGAMGSTFRLPVAVEGPMAEAIGSARAAGARICATVPRGGTPLPRADLRTPAAIVLGGEGAGLPAAVLDSADERLTIPMQPPVESLNVAIAAALILYEASRQRSSGVRAGAD